MSKLKNTMQSSAEQRALACEHELHEYKKKIANILESFTDGFFEVDKEWVITYWNKEAERILGNSKSEVMGKNLWDIYERSDYAKFSFEFHKAVEENSSIRFQEFFQPRGLWIEVAVFPSGDGLSVYFKDISAMKETAALLERERQKYTDLFNLSPVPQWVYDFETLAFLDVNEAAIQHYGYNREEFLTMTIKDIRPESDIPALEATLCTAVIPGFFNKSSVRHQKKNGEIISVCVEGNSVFFEGRSARLVMVIDRTAEIKAGLALEESVKRFNIVSKATSDVIWDWDMQIDEVIWNKGIKGIFGHDIKCSTKQWWEDHVDPDDLGRVLNEIELLFESKQEKVKLEYRFRCADGSYRFVLDRAFIIFNSEGLPIRMTGSMQDVTEHVNSMVAIEQQNLRLQEISWIQSHKVRSPLARLLGLVSLISADQHDFDSIQELVPLIKSSAEELDTILNEILKKIE